MSEIISFGVFDRRSLCSIFCDKDRAINDLILSHFINLLIKNVSLVFVMNAPKELNFFFCSTNDVKAVDFTLLKSLKNLVFGDDGFDKGICEEVANGKIGFQIS